MIKLILLDADGVVIKARQKYFSQRMEEDYGVPSEKVMELLKNEFKDCVIGKRDLKEILQSKYLKEWNWEGTVDELLDYWWKGEEEVDLGVLEIVKKLKGKGIDVVLATDQEKYRGEHIIYDLGINKYMDCSFVSYLTGIKKDNPQYFEAVMLAYGVTPADLIYWDDEEENLEAATSVGIHSRKYIDFPTFEMEVNSLL